MNMIIFIIFPFIIMIIIIRFIMIMTLWSSRFVKELWRRRQKLWFRWQLTELSKVRLGAFWGMGHLSILGCLVRFVKMGNNRERFFFWQCHNFMTDLRTCYDFRFVKTLWFQICEKIMNSDLWKYHDFRFVKILRFQICENGILKFRPRSKVAPGYPRAGRGFALKMIISSKFDQHGFGHHHP